MNDESNILDYLSQEDLSGIEGFMIDKKTPFLVISLKQIAENYDELVKNVPYAKVYYAIKANPENEVIKVLHEKGSNFDVATVFEMQQLFDLGISPDRMSYGNTIKKEVDIEFAYKKGIRLFATDSMSDVQKLARKAPGSRVFFRILTEGGNADWPLSRKFGANPDMIYHLIVEAKRLGLEPYGLSFHVGSQQREIGQWDTAISQCKYLFDSLRDDDIELKMINLGGGFPTNYVKPVHPLDVYAKEITRFLEEDFGDNFPEIIVEPGRSIAGNSGVMVSEVVMVSKKSVLNQHGWVYIDAGKFGGLIETIDESIKYPIYVDGINSNKGGEEVILAGPTCDSMDILYEDYKYRLPAKIKEGDKLLILSTGAYTTTYSSVYFNGFPPLKAYVVKDWENCEEVGGEVKSDKKKEEKE